MHRSKATSSRCAKGLLISIATLMLTGIVSAQPPNGPQAVPATVSPYSPTPTRSNSPPVLTAPQPAASENNLFGPSVVAPNRLPTAEQQPVVLTSAAIMQPPGPSNQGMDDLMKRLESTERELSDLKANQAQQSPAPAEEEKATILDRLKGLEESLKADRNKYPMIRLSGFFQYDTGFFSQSANSIATLGDIQNGSSFRRARLQALGYLSPQTRYSIEMDFGNAGGGRPSFQDVWGEQTDLTLLGNLRVGQYRQPITMDSWTNIKHLEFLERSLPFQAFDPFRRVGAMAWRNSDDELSLFAAAVYGTGVTFWNGTSTTYNTLGVDNRFGTQIGDQGGVSFAMRGTHLLYYDELADGRYLLHVGGGYNFSEIGGNGYSTTSTDSRTYQARAIPEFFVGDSAAGGNTTGGTPFFVDTGRFLATSYNLYHAELAGNYGPAHFQFEYLATGVNQLAGPVVFYDGAYLQGGYFLTGESCGYNKAMGALDYNVKPYSDFFGLGPRYGICGWGAWELAGRWSYLDLSATNVNTANLVSPALPATNPSVTGTTPSPNPGILNESTVALNWWWNMYTRVQFNWIHAMLNNNFHGNSTCDIYTLRFQTEF